jgi:nitroreductase
MEQKFFVLLLACGILACFACSAWAGDETIMNGTLKTIFSRKSVRSYKDEPISKEKLEMIIKAGMAAPTAVDKRPWEFIVITDKKVLNQLADSLPYSKMASSAAAAIVVGGDVRKQWGGMESDYWIMDCSAATENILLAAESMGLGAVWTAVYPEDARIRSVREILGIPFYIVPLNLIPLGTPAGTEKPKDKYNPRQVHWNKW